MKKFNLPLTTAVSAAILAAAGCSSGREWQVADDSHVCVDGDQKRVSDNQCANPAPGDGHIPYRWYYISHGGYVPYIGYPVSGGSWAPASSSRGFSSVPAEAPPGAVTRGGFGSVGEGHAGGAGGGE